MYYYNFLVSSCFTFHFRDNKIRCCLIIILKFFIQNLLLDYTNLSWQRIDLTFIIFVINIIISSCREEPAGVQKRRNFDYILLPQQWAICCINSSDTSGPPIPPHFWYKIMTLFSETFNFLPESIFSPVFMHFAGFRGFFWKKPESLMKLIFTPLNKYETL